MKDLEECIQSISYKHFFIQDDIQNQPAYIVATNGQFEVINHTKKDIRFLQIDDCIKFDNDDKKCDCAVYNDDIFCFIEQKSMSSQKPSTIAKRRKNAEKQLKYTILNFKENQIVKNKKLEAYVSITCNHDSKLTRITNVRNQNAIVEFEDNYNVNLYYECKKEFIRIK